MKSILTVIGLSLAFVSPASAGIEWNFPNESTSVGATVGTGTATISPGTFGNPAWYSGTSIPWTLGASVPAASGFWDLGGQNGVSGHPGSIMLSGFSVSGPVTLNVFQWVSPGTYSGLLNYSLNSGPVLGQLGAVTQVGAAGSDGGAWWEYAANLGALTPGETITVSAGTGGAIIDRLTLVPEPTTLIAGAILLVPFALSTLPILRRRRSS